MTNRRGKQQDSFQWSDDEVELLLTLTHEYKVKHSGECTDWEKVKTKYVDILALFWEQLPSGTEEASQPKKDYPHHPDQITLNRLKYRQAIDSGKKSGHGRVIMCYFDLCNKIWAGHQQRYKLHLAWRVLTFLQLQQMMAESHQLLCQMLLA